MPGGGASKLDASRPSAIPDSPSPPGYPLFPLAAPSADPVFSAAMKTFLVAALLWKFGMPVREFIERRLGLVFTLFVGCLLVAFVALRYL